MQTRNRSAYGIIETVLLVIGLWIIVLLCRFGPWII
jgi:hypothetical protein